MFTLQLIFVGFFLYGCATSQKNESEPRIYKIIGGEKVENNEFPFMASIQLNGEHICGGSIIHERVVITAHQCFDEIIRKYTPIMLQIYIQVGTNDLTNGGQKYFLESYIWDTSYTHNPFIYDLGFIIITNKIEFNFHVWPIEVENEFIGNDIPAQVVGFGAINRDLDQPSQILQKLDVHTKIESCHLQNPNFNPKFLIGAMKDNNSGICIRDAGNPLIANDKLIGVASFGTKRCASGYCDIYQRISERLDIIKAAIEYADSNLKSKQSRYN